MKGDHLGELEELVMLAVRAQGDDAYGVTVERLERKELVLSRMGGGAAKQGGRRKRLFRLTRQGNDTLASTRDARAALWGLAEANDG